jgi:hypothetical protein
MLIVFSRRASSLVSRQVDPPNNLGWLGIFVVWARCAW